MALAYLLIGVFSANYLFIVSQFLITMNIFSGKLLAGIAILFLFTINSPADALAGAPIPGPDSIFPGKLAENTSHEHNRDSINCTRNWSMYSEYHRHRIYHLAFEPWKYMFDNCPDQTINIYIHGPAIIRHQYDNETDPDKKEELLALLMKVFDQRITYFGDEGYVLGRKAVSLYQLQPNNVDKLLDLTERSIELEGMEAETPVLLINFQSALRLAEAGLSGTDAILERFDRALDIIHYNLEQNPQNKQAYQNTANQLKSLFEPYATCENLVRMFKPRFDADPDNPGLLHRITSMLDNAGCSEVELFLNATGRLHQIAPDAESAFLLGRLENNRENFESAMAYFREAIDRYSEKDQEIHKERMFRTYLLMTEISFRQLGQKTQAREFARKAHGLYPNDGRPLILIGEMYADSVNECGDDAFTKSTIYWPAVDKFNQAIQLAADPSVKDRAEQLSNIYKQYFPNGEDIFFHGYNQGDTYRVACWINKNTTIRAR